MKKLNRRIIPLVLAAVFFTALPFDALAVEGSFGYEGGISVEDRTANNEYQYSEMCFITGKPILFTGTLTIKKTDKKGTLNSTYTYRLSNPDNNATLTRVVLYTTTSETKANGQKTETTRLSRLPTETITIDGVVYRLIDAGFSKSLLTDPKAAINYNSGEFSEEKTYRIGTDNEDTVTVSVSGRLYDYDQYWSSTQTQKINVLVETDIKSGEEPVSWGGSAELTVSSVTRRQVYYAENEPTQISFEGGYVMKSWTESAVDYTARFPEFDKNGNHTNVLKNYSDTLSLSTAPDLSRLMVPDLKHLGGFWAEEPISILFGLEIIPGTGSSYRPEKNVTRGEFTVMLVNALKDIPEDPDVRKSTYTRRTSSKTPEVSPFKDVATTHPYYDKIKEAYAKGIAAGTDNGIFRPDWFITRADAVKMLVAALGLENLAPYPATAAPFADNDLIPEYARNAVTVANELGLISPDQWGRFNPSKGLTNEETAVLLYSLINYMGDEMIRDYRDRIMEF